MPADTPKVIVWFRVYSGVFAAIYLACAVGALIFFAMEPANLANGDPGAVFMGYMLLLIGVVFAAAFLVPFFLKPKPWVWIYDLVLICIGLTSPCCMLASIPLLIYWLKPDAKAYFGRQ